MSEELNLPAATAESKERPYIERVLGMVVAVVCGLMMAGGVVVVFLGVIYRYFLSNPLQWTNEAATSALVGVTFLGGALTLYRNEHIGVLAVRNRLAGRWEQLAAGFSAWVVFIVSAGLTWSSVPLLRNIAGQTTTSGLLPASIFYYPLLIGGAAMCVFAMFRVARVELYAIAISAGIVAVIVGALMLGTSAISITGTMSVWFMLIAIIVCLLVGIPVSYSLGAGGLVYMGVTHSVPLVQFAQEMESGTENFVLLAIPFFVLAGLVMEVNGMSRRLIDFLSLLLGRVRGGMSLVLIVSMAVFSGISGSKSADVVAVGSVMTPAMRRAGHDDNDSVALLAATAVMGETIPPCINMIILGYVANVSIGGLFLAGILPAGIMAVALAAIAILVARRTMSLRDNSAAVSGPEGVETTPPRQSVSMRHILSSTGGALSAIAMILIIFGGIEGGIATPTEVSSVAVIYALVVGGLAFREMPWRSFGDFWVRSASMSGMILFIVASAQLLTYILTVNTIPQRMAAALTGVAASSGTWAFLLISIGMLIVMGSVLEGAPALILFGPLLLPAATELGINPLHFGILLVISMGIGLFAPPLGVGLYTACAVGRTSVESVAWPIAKYLVVIFVVLLLIAFVPAITLTLPGQ